MMLEAFTTKYEAPPGLTNGHLILAAMCLLIMGFCIGWILARYA